MFCYSYNHTLLCGGEREEFIIYLHNVATAEVVLKLPQKIPHLWMSPSSGLAYLGGLYTLMYIVEVCSVPVG